MSGALHVVTERPETRLQFELALSTAVNRVKSCTAVFVDAVADLEDANRALDALTDHPIPWEQ